eukprot:9026124-Karenia_brevis.AAC.1
MVTVPTSMAVELALLICVNLATFPASMTAALALRNVPTLRCRNPPRRESDARAPRGPLGGTWENSRTGDPRAC